MRHCCKFKADDIYYLCESSMYKTRMLHIGFCPICHKPVAELQKIRFDGAIEKECYAGIKANDFVINLQKEIKYSWQQYNAQRVKQAPTGWKYGENKLIKSKGKEYVRQYAHDFYNNKQLNFCNDSVGVNFCLGPTILKVYHCVSSSDIY